MLVPQYLQAVPEKDGWKKDYRTTGWRPPTCSQQQVMAIALRRPRRQHAAGTYTVAGFDPTDYDQDIVWADGFFVRWPQKTN